MRKIALLIMLIQFLSITILYSQEKIKTDTFTFVFEGEKRSGLISLPLNSDPVASVIIVPGHEMTDFGKPHWYYDALISIFTDNGLACIRWDKAGCGDSEGEYNHNQTVQNSAAEVLAAIHEVKRQKLPASSKIGLWGISRAGYICPLVIQNEPSIAFWISVSGTDGLNSYPYKLQSDLIFAGLDEAKAELFVSEYLKQKALIENGGSFEEYEQLKSDQKFRKNDFFMSYLNIDRVFPKEFYYKYQKSLKVEYLRDEKSNLRILVPDFPDVLKGVSCPVLALFGEKDFVVDWRKTLSLYEETIGANGGNLLTVKTFPNGNHSVIKCTTGASNEIIEKLEFCNEYLNSIDLWLKGINLENN